MSRAAWETVADVIGIAVALWVLSGAAFPGRDSTILQGVALLVIGISGWRLYRRLRDRP
jgi:hypothetical protein